MESAQFFCRRAVLEDAQTIAEIHVASWQAAYEKFFPADYLANLSVKNRRQMWERLIKADSPRAALLVAGSDDEINGFIAAGPARGLDSALNWGEVSAIYVDPSAWRTPVGYTLMESACAFLWEQNHQQIMLWVLDGNDRAIRFYERYGFVKDTSPSGVQIEQIGGVSVREIRYLLSNWV
ncbi:MAG: GNAT family N-acetyltransferase [Chloroflexota bacterium]